MRDVVVGARILSSMQNAARPGDSTKSDLFVLSRMVDCLKAKEPNEDSTLSDYTSLAVVNTTKSAHEEIGEELGASPESNCRYRFKPRASGGCRLCLVPFPQATPGISILYLRKCQRNV
jgi:hypothetical protein